MSKHDTLLCSLVGVNLTISYSRVALICEFEVPCVNVSLLFGSFHFSFFILVDEVTKNENRFCDFLYYVFCLQGKTGKTKNDK